MNSSSSASNRERNEWFVGWLKENEREGYVLAFLDLQENRPSVLGSLDNADWVDIFLKLSPAGPEQALDLCELFSGVSL